MGEINWDSIYSKLEAWRKTLTSSKSFDKDSKLELLPKEPAVTTVAEYYSHSPWAVLVSTILSLRTKDEVTLKASKKLLARARNPEALSKLSEEEIAKLSYPAGFYRTKAKNLKKIALILLEKYDGKVPSDMEALLSLPGVGRKTANLVLIEAFDLPGICVDIHVHRIAGRTGWLFSKTPLETEMILREILPLKYWKGLNALLVLYGQNICRPVSPYCSRCVIFDFCKKIGVTTKR
jgi:endonuclease-3